MTEESKQARVSCSFCGKEAKYVNKMISGAVDVNICDECVRLCLTIVTDDETVTPTNEDSLEQLRPSAIKKYLDEHVIGQERAKRVLSVAIYNHYKRINDDEERDDDVELSKGNVLLIGPTGSGKTLLARTLAKRLNVPFTMADATSLTEAGYVGEDVDSVVKSLWLSAGRDTELAGRGIVCIDELDKLARAGSSPSSVRDVGGEGVQQALLKIIESQKVNITPDANRGRPQQELITVDTTNILFICCGAFNGLEQIIERRTRKSRLGFGADFTQDQQDKDDLMAQVRPEDLVQFGLVPEFVGRIPVIVTLDELDERSLVEILWKPKNALIRQYQHLFELENVKLKFHEDAMVAVVQQAIERGTGARGLRSILEAVMLEIMYDLPSLEGLQECIITESTVLKGEAPVLVFDKKSA